MKNIFLFLCLLFISSQVSADNYRFLVGTYTTNTASKGIYSISCNFDSAKVDVKVAATNVYDPSFLAITPDKKFVYSISERGKNSSIASFVFDKENGLLKEINRVPANGKDPCFVSVSQLHVIEGNYNGGNICVFNRRSDGSLSETIQNIQHVGNSINSERQSTPHVHQTIFSPDQKFVLVNDLGTDYVTSYHYDENAEKNVLTAFDSIKVKPGSGPRHLTFHPNGKIIYVLQELDGTLTTLGYNGGKLSKQAETTVMRKPNITAGAADIHISPDGKFLYASNRGTANDLTCFKIENDGSLTFIDQTFVLGIGPRNFAITHDGDYLLVGNQQCNLITVFKRDKETGKLMDTELFVDVPAPVCILEY